VYVAPICLQICFPYAVPSMLAPYFYMIHPFPRCGFPPLLVVYPIPIRFTIWPRSQYVSPPFFPSPKSCRSTAGAIIFPSLYDPLVYFPLPFKSCMVFAGACSVSPGVVLVSRWVLRAIPASGELVSWVWVCCVYWRWWEPRVGRIVRCDRR
jgi:hypothetical protein